MNTRKSERKKLFQYENPYSYVCSRGRSAAIKYENAVRTNRVFHVSPISRGKRHSYKECAPLCRSNQHDQSFPVPVFRVLQKCSCVKRKKHHAFFFISKEYIRETFF